MTGSLHSIWGRQPTRLIADKITGYMAVVKIMILPKAPLAEAAGKLKTVDPG